MKLPLNLLLEYADVFAKSADDMGRTGLVKHRINIGDAQPIRQRARRLPIHQRKEEQALIKEMLDRQVITPSSSPWASGIVLVKKKDGSWRFCVDYRRLNEVTVKDSFGLPRIDDSLDTLGGAKWFSTLDLQSGYWQVEMEEGSKEKTAFICSSGLYQFERMPFGLCNSPATFERLMERVLAGLQWQVCLIFLDDVIVYGTSFGNQLERLQLVFERLRSANLILSPKKCELFQQEVAYLGHIVSQDGIAPDPSKIKSIQTWPQPSNVTEVRSFLGLCSYYRRFIKNFSAVARSLHQLTEKNKAFLWTEECIEAFYHLKQRLTQAPILAYPKPGDPYILDTDASQFGIGGVLSQVQDGDERVIAYFSRTLSKPERRYCVTRKELLAVVQSVKHFHHYIYGTKFSVRTDHNALRWLMNFKSPTGQTARWLEVLGTYDVTIEFRPGLKHGNADGLSRRPCDECKQCDRIENAEQVENARRVAAVSQAVLQEVLTNLDDENNDESGLQYEQRDDADISMIIRWLEEGQRPPWSQVSPESREVKCLWTQWDRLQQRNGVLYRRWESEAGGHITWQLVVPKVRRNDILRQLHNVRTAGHLDVKKTEGRIQERFYWPNYRADVRYWCRVCDLCATRKRPHNTPRAPMQLYQVGAPMERVAVDVTGPLVESDIGNKYILMVCDYFTRWTEAFALPNQEAISIAEVLVEQFFCRFGCPNQLHSDQGRNFESEIFQGVCELMGIEKTRTTPLHPQSDGLVERFNRTLKDMLSLFVEANQRDWDKHLPYLMMAYRSAVHESTGYRPVEMMLGRNMNLPVDLETERPSANGEEVITPLEFLYQLKERMEVIHRFARENMRRASERQKKYYDLKARNHLYKRGDAVWLHNPTRKKGLSPKLQAVGRAIFGHRLSERCDLSNTEDKAYQAQNSSQ